MTPVVMVEAFWHFTCSETRTVYLLVIKALEEKYNNIQLFERERERETERERERETWMNF